MRETRFEKRIQFNKKSGHKIYNLIARIDEIKGQWKGSSNLLPQILNRLQRTVLVTSSGASTRIEGSKLTDLEVEKLLNNIKIQKFKDRDEQEVAGYAALLKNIFDSWETIILSENMIKHFHKELLKYSQKDKRHKGVYKFGPNRVEAKDRQGKVVGIIFDPTPPHLTSKEMSEVMDWTRQSFKEKKYHPLLIIANFIFEFLSIHPFQDGNGRSSRILTNFLLLKSGYLYIPYVSHEKIIEDNKEEYYLALKRSQSTWKTKNENIDEWILFFLNVLLKQSKIALELLKGESIELLLSEKQLLVWNYILEKKYVTPKEIQNDLGIPKPTVVQILNKLLKLKRIERLGFGRSTRYRLK